MLTFWQFFGQWLKRAFNQTYHFSGHLRAVEWIVRVGLTIVFLGAVVGVFAKILFWVSLALGVLGCLYLLFNLINVPHRLYNECQEHGGMETQALMEQIKKQQLAIETLAKEIAKTKAETSSKYEAQAVLAQGLVALNNRRATLLNTIEDFKYSDEVNEKENAITEELFTAIGNSLIPHFGIGRMTKFRLVTPLSPPPLPVGFCPSLAGRFQKYWIHIRVIEAHLDYLKELVESKN